MINGDKDVIAIRPNALVALLEEKEEEKPRANGKTKALEIGPDATLPESNAIAENSEGVKIVRMKINR